MTRTHEAGGGRRAHAADRRHRQGHRQGQIHRRPRRPAGFSGASCSVPAACPHRSSTPRGRRRCRECAAVCTGADCRCRSACCRSPRTNSPGAGEGALSRRPGGRGGGGRRGDRRQGAQADPGRIRGAAGVFRRQVATKPGACDPRDKPNNVLREVQLQFGDAEAGFKAADLVREKTYKFAEVNHAHMEPNATLAEYDPQRATDAAHHHPGALLRPAQGRALPGDGGGPRPVVKPFVGGGFGARTECLHFDIIAACWRARRAAPCGCCRPARKHSSPIAAGPIRRSPSSSA